MCPIKAVISASKVVINQSMWYMHRLVVGGAAAAWWLWPTLVGLNPVCCYCQVSVAHLPHLLPSPEPSPGDDCLSWPVSPPLVAAACLTPPPPAATARWRHWPVSVAFATWCMALEDKAHRLLGATEAIFKYAGGWVGGGR